MSVVIYFCSVTSINGEFKIGMKNFTIMSEVEHGNIFKAEATVNPSAALKASTAPPDTKDSANKEV